MPVSKAEWREFSAVDGDSTPALTTIAQLAQIVIMVVLAAIMGVIALFLVAFAALYSPYLSAMRENPFSYVIVWLVALGCVLLVVWFVRLCIDAGRREFRFGFQRRRSIAVRRFALEHPGWRYEASRSNPNEPGAIFHAGERRKVRDLVVTPQFTVGNYEYAGHWMRERVLRRWGYVRIPLARPLPNMVLEANANRRSYGRSNLPFAFRGAQRISLEGDFDTYFTLYAPVAYAADARYVFTPDLMALLIDSTSTYDVEIVDSWMYIYAPRPFRLHEPDTWDRILSLVEVVGARAQRQTARYADARAGHPGRTIAPQGRRLQRGLPILGIVVLVVFVALRLGDAFLW